MKTINCNHCGENITAEDKTCPHCGIPLAPNHGKSTQRRFIYWFLVIAIFCFVMIYLLPFFGSTRFPGR